MSLTDIAARLRAARDALFDNGVEQRKRVLGAAWVERSLANRNAFTGEWQELITRFAWGEVWSRPGLDDKTRRFLVLAITIALGRWEEFKLHVRAGIEQNGFSVEELKEVIMQSAIYAGVPAANTAFHEAEALLRTMGQL
jgi:3-oxoadipate enol-lactonase/4-carboxymuconolactone decarboxylase